MSKKKRKPAPISTKLSKRPKKPEAPATEPFNDVSPITAEQMERAERDIVGLRAEVKELRKKQPAPEIKVEAPTPQVVIPARPLIAKVKIKYDPFGAPMELVPVYREA